MERKANAGISILVVGAGIAGLSFAIEAHRKGHNVRMIERRPRGETSGKHRTNTKKSSTPSHLILNHQKEVITAKPDVIADCDVHGHSMQAKSS